MGLLFIINLYLARYLGPLQFGVLCYASSFVSIFIPLGILGLDSALVQALVKNPSQRLYLLGSAYLLRISSVLFAWLLMGITLLFLEVAATTQKLIAIIALLLLFQTAQVIDYYFQAQLRARYVARALLTQIILSTALKAGLIYLEADLIWFAVVYPADAFILALLLFRYYYRWIQQEYPTESPSLLAWRWQSVTASSLLATGLPLMVSAFMTAFYFKIDQLLLHAWLGAEAVGLYAVAAQISEACYAIPILMATAFFPVMLQLRSQQPDTYPIQLQTLFNRSVLTALTMALPLSYLAPWLIQKLYGMAYTTAAQVLAIHSWSLIGVFLGVISQQYLLAEGFTTVIIWRNGLGILSHIGLSAYLIPAWGITGAAWSLLCSIFIANCFSHALFKKTRPLFWMQLQALSLPPLQAVAKAAYGRLMRK